MSNRPSFGRDINDFLKSLGQTKGEIGESRASGVRILALSSSGSERITVRLSVFNPSGQEELEYVLLREHVEELTLSVGECDETVLPEIEYYAEVARAYSSACSSFAYAQSSVRALFNKLLQKGFPRDVCEDAMLCVRSRGFVNEDEIALRRAQIMVDKRWGRTRILMKLREEGFEEDALSSVLTYLSEVDFCSNCAALIQKRFGALPDGRHERELMHASLSRMGYSGTEIKEAMKSLNTRN